MLIESKARTLANLRGQLKTATVLPQVTFTVGKWQKHRASCIQEVITNLGVDALIVRSSAANEDTKTESLAGHFESVLNVSGLDNLGEAIERVVASYKDGDPELDEVLIQPMLKDIKRSGVAFSVDPNTCAPYRVINYYEGMDTTAVTSGKSALTYVQAAGSKVDYPQTMFPIISLIHELERLIPDLPLDIEFAICGVEEILYLLQVRPLVLRQQVSAIEDLQENLDAIEKKVKSGFNPHPFLHGQKTVYGVMPDWDPAEIIGVRPRPLALSLYKELITDSIWAYQRNNYGYKNLRSFPLLVHFQGLPYIDVRVSFNSFIPRNVEKNLADRLVDYYINRLLEAPSLHDKVEFEILFSCYSLDLHERLETLKQAGFSDSDCEKLSDSLRDLTNKIINKDNGLWRADRDKLQLLDQRRDQVFEGDLDSISRVYWLLEDCKRYGTLPFAGLARAGFIAVQMLKSLVTVGVIDHSDYHAFMNGLSTESGQLIRDQSILSKSTFLSKYGHLRPGTYDILSPRYDEAPDLYFDWSNVSDSKREKEGDSKPFALKLEQLRNISSLLREHGLDADVVGLFDFLEAGITLREKAKFFFTRNLSDAISLIGDIGEDHGFSTDDVSYANIQTFYDLYSSSGNVKDLLSQSIDEGRRRYENTSKLWLPSLITKPQDIWGFHVLSSEPNFITQKSVVAHVAKDTDKNGLAGAIIAIPNADPGYDWLFSHPIAGLVTAYGGVNSHMAIRAGELGLPAIIGAGETQFNKWSNSNMLSIDCAGKRVEVLS